MRRLILFMSLWISYFIASAATDNSLSIKFEFDRSNVELSQKDNGISVFFNDPTVFYPTREEYDCLPVVTRYVALPEGTKLTGINVSNVKTINMGHYTKIMPGSEIGATGQDEIDLKEDNSVADGNSVMGIKTNVFSSAEYNFNGHTVVRLNFSPVSYDMALGALIFFQSIEAEFIYEMSGNSAQYEFDPQLEEYVFSNVVNPEIIAIGRTDDMYVVMDGSDQLGLVLDYAIITSKQFAGCFDELVAWKIKKGVATKIYYIEDIFEDAALDKPLILKSFVYKLYKDNKMKYLLLAGDENIIPVRMCRARTSSNDFVPSDLYYACFKGQFDWDLNKDGVYGEYADNVVLDPDIYVSRIPISNRDNIISYITKVLGYEKNPFQNGPWKDKILFGGSKLYYNTDKGASDAEDMGAMMYKYGIYPYSEVQVDLLYDTNTTFRGGSAYDFSSVNLQTALESGYAYIDINTHGNYNRWTMESSIDKYTTVNASLLSNKQYCLITTEACKTNAFHETNECLSQAFINNIDSGVVAYFGSSCSGWGYVNYINKMGFSASINAAFYKYLFNPKCVHKNFSAVVANAKRDFIGASQYDPYYLELLYSINPIGDAEMPLYSEVPKEIPSIGYTYRNNVLTIIFDKEGYDLCVTGLKINNKTLFKSLKDCKSVVEIEGLNTDFSLCVTGSNYIPKAYVGKFIGSSDSSVGNMTLQLTEEENGVEKAEQSMKSGRITNVTYDGIAVIKIGIESYEIDGVVEIRDICGNLMCETSVTIGEPVIVNADGWNDGVYVISYVSDGALIDSKKMIK